MQQIATTFQSRAYERGPFVIPVRTVDRVRIRTRLRRARTDYLPLYLGAGAAGVACGFLLSIA